MRKFHEFFQFSKIWKKQTDKKNDLKIFLIDKKTLSLFLLKLVLQPATLQKQRTPLRAF